FRPEGAGVNSQGRQPLAGGVVPAGTPLGAPDRLRLVLRIPSSYFAARTPDPPSCASPLTKGPWNGSLVPPSPAAPPLGTAPAGLPLPTDNSPPLAMLSPHVTVSIDEQVAQTRVEQTFENPHSRDLEATYVFPVPKGASVNKFSMWIDGKEVKGELVEAEQAR